MKAETYSALLKDLQKLQKAIVASQIKAVRDNPVMWATMVRLHAEAEVGGRVDDFVAMTARKSTVLFLLRTVFVRVLEDLGILVLRRIREDWGFAAFREVGPALGLRAYFAFVFRDLAVDFPALFTAGEDELPIPDEDSCRDLWQMWHHPNKQGESYIWNGEGFDSHFLGELYQGLDADIRKQYALLQTPPFVEKYILDHTLTPALAEFDPGKLWEVGERFRVIDPTCGSGHFLIGVFHRLADYWRDRHGLKEWAACERALESVWGCDINPHAVEIAAFRLMLEVVTRTGVKDLEGPQGLAGLKLNVRAMDSLIPWERTAKQGELFPAKDRLDAYATPEQRAENAAFLRRDFHVVVGNPPYITPKEVAKRDDYRVFWPRSCHKNYALCAPFLERLIGLAARDGFIGAINSNSFMKRAFGKPLIEKVLPLFDLQVVVDGTGLVLAGHGTPTVITFVRNRAPSSPTVRALLGKRGDPGASKDPEHGPVWTAICSAPATPSEDNSYISVADVSRATFDKHPWSLGGGAAAEAVDILEASSTSKLDEHLARLPNQQMVPPGRTTVAGEDDLWIFDVTPPWLRVQPVATRPLVMGEWVRDFSAESAFQIVWPYPAPTDARKSKMMQWLWRWRVVLESRRIFGRTVVEAGRPWWSHLEHYPARLRDSLGITFAFVSTHNHFVLDRSGRAFNRSAPVIKLRAGSTEQDYLDMLGLLTTSSLGFWMRQIFHNKGAGAHPTIRMEDYEQFYEYDATKLLKTPISSRSREPRIALARALDATAQERAACLPAALLAANTWSPATLASDLLAAHTRYLAHTRRMVALQEELDWLTYSSYGLIDPVPIVAPDAIEPLAPGHRPFEIVLARKDDEADDDEKSAWWSRHGHERVSEIPDTLSPSLRERLQQRIDLIESDVRLALLETPPYKRRWQLADWESESKQAAESWLLDRLEDLFAAATDTAAAGPLAEPRPYRLEEITQAWTLDPRVGAVAGVWAGTGQSVEITMVAEKLLKSNAVPDNPHRVYSEEGLRKLREWKRVWALQDQEDAWEKAVAEAKARGESGPKKRLVDPDDSTKELESIPLPPKLDKTDFVKAELFSIRGKLNVPRERFVLFAEVWPPRYGWNGWRDRERALAQVEAFTLAEKDPLQPLPLPTVEDPRRCGVTYGLWESLPDVRRWGDHEEHAELQSLAREACRQPQCPCPVEDAWKARVLHAKATPDSLRKGKAGRLPVLQDSDDDAPSERPVVASLAERAWVVTLFAAGKELELASVWSRHRARLSEPPQLAIPGVGGPPAQLTMPGLGSGPPSALTALDEARLAFVLDDLVASGDVEVRGRGKKRRYKVVPRGVSS